MAESKIEWTDFTFNPWIGCSKVSPGCANCYAERDFDRRKGRVKWGPNGTRSKTSEANWKLPLKWNREAAQRNEQWLIEVRGTAECLGDPRPPKPHRPRVFCASLADVFEDWQGPIVNHRGNELWHEPDERGKCEVLTMADLRRDLFQLIDATPHLDWLLVTKRPENIRRMWVPPTCTFCESSPCDRLDECHSFAAMVHHNGQSPLYRPNVWLLTSGENQETADKRIPELLKCRDLSPVLGLSCEPLLGPVDLSEHNYWQCPTCRTDGTHEWSECPKHGAIQFGSGIDWLICGGESGPGARPCDVLWIKSILDQCHAAGVPCFVKQLGANSVIGTEDARQPWRDKKGGDASEWPEELQVREFPTPGLRARPSPQEKTREGEVNGRV